MIALARTAAAKVLASDSDLSLPEHRVIIDYIKENQREN